MKKQTKTKTHILLFVLMLSLVPVINLTHLSIAQPVDYSHWNVDLTFQINNGTAINSTEAVFAPFDLITLKAEITNASTVVPESEITFNIKGPKATTNATEIVRSELTNSNNSTSIDFRIPIESNEKIIGEWQVYVNAKIADTVLTQNTTFQVNWPVQNLSIAFIDKQGHSQTSFNTEDNVTAVITYENNRQQTQNISLNIKDSNGSSITQQTLQVTANATKDNKATFEFTIPKNTSNGTAQADINIYSGEYQNRTILAAENKTATFKIGNTANTQTPTPTATPTPTPASDKENTIKWLPWLAAITGIITFITLIMFLKRKNTKKEEETPTTTLQTSPTVSSDENIKASLTQTQAILNQNTQPDQLMQDTTTIAQHLNNIAITTKKIQELQTALKTEQEHLNKNVDELNQTIAKQEKIIKNYYDTIRNEVKKAQQHANNQDTPATEQKENKN
jgi:hypothetical protein